MRSNLLLVRKGAAAMGVFDTDTWKQQWETFLNAPYIIASFMAGAGMIGWWLCGIKSGRKIDGLEARIIVFEDRLKFADERAAHADEVRDDVIRQFQTYRTEVDAANIGNSALSATAAKLEAALDKLVAATNEARSAIGVGAGTSAATGISGPLSNTPLASSAAQAEIHKWWK
jgi:hypothetical protein